MHSQTVDSVYRRLDVTTTLDLDWSWTTVMSAMEVTSVVGDTLAHSLDTVSSYNDYYNVKQF